MVFSAKNIQARIIFDQSKLLDKFQFISASSPLFFFNATRVQQSKNPDLKQSGFFWRQKEKPTPMRELLQNMVEVTGLEPAASASRTQRSTKLSHTSIAVSF